MRRGVKVEDQGLPEPRPGYRQKPSQDAHHQTYKERASPAHRKQPTRKGISEPHAQRAQLLRVSRLGTPTASLVSFQLTCLQSPGSCPCSLSLYPWEQETPGSHLPPSSRNTQWFAYLCGGVLLPQAEAGESSPSFSDLATCTGALAARGCDGDGGVGDFPSPHPPHRKKLREGGGEKRGNTAKVRSTCSVPS